jgi:class 3 adenylate cyclase
VIVGRGVSRLHAVLTLDGDEILVEDQDSTYGTKVNGRQLRSAKVGVGDHIDIGVFRLIVVPSAERIEETPDEPQTGAVPPPTPEDGHPVGRWDEPTMAVFTTSDYTLGEVSNPGIDPQATALFRTDEAGGLRRISHLSEARAPAQEASRPKGASEGTGPRSRYPSSPQLSAYASPQVAAVGTPPGAGESPSETLVLKSVEQLARSANLGTFLDDALELTLQTLAMNSAMLVKRDDLGKLKAISVRHAEGSAQAEIPLSRSVIDQAMRTGRPVQSRDLQSDPSFGVRDSVMASRRGALLAAPLLAGDQTVGAICLYRRSNQPFEPQEVEAVSCVSGLLGKAMSLLELEQKSGEERRRRLLLERFHSPELVEQLYESGDARELHSQVLTVLHVEMTHFERFLERGGLTRAADLAEAFRALVHAAVFGNGGTLVWLHEDSGLAIFGGQGTAESDAAWALASAGAMLREFGTIASSFSLPQKIALRIGLDRGPVLRGLLGPTERLQMTALGAPVVRARDAARAGMANTIHASANVLEQVPSPRGQIQRLEPETTGLDQPIFEIVL